MQSHGKKVITLLGCTRSTGRHLLNPAFTAAENRRQAGEKNGGENLLNRQ